MKQIIKTLYKIIRLSIVLICIIVTNANSISLENKVENINLNKSVDLKAMTIMVNNIEKDVINPISYERQYTVHEEKYSLEGHLTGYVYNCEKCTGKLACLSSLDLSSGNVHYEDKTYGTVNIVASSKNLPCGSIIKFSKNTISPNPIIAIVLDRGVGGNNIDLLTNDLAFAYSNIGRSDISYSVLRTGWEQ